MRWSEFKARYRSNIPAKPRHDTITSEHEGTIDEGWDYGNGTIADTIALKRMTALQEDTVSGTIRPVKGSQGQLFERDVQRTPRKISIGEAYTEDGMTAERKRLETVVINENIDGIPQRPVSQCANSGYSYPLISLVSLPAQRRAFPLCSIKQKSIAGRFDGDPNTSARVSDATTTCFAFGHVGRRVRFVTSLKRAALTSAHRIGPLNLLLGSLPPCR